MCGRFVGYRRKEELMDLFPAKDWIDLGNLLILHGRAVCPARRPDCVRCHVESHCPKIAVDRPATKRKTSRPPTRPLRERIGAAKRKRS